jgi:RHS repeat-associated protein
MAYDLLGRLVKRVDGYTGTISGGPGQTSQSTNGCANPGAGSESSTWVFDTASVKGIGQLAAVSGPGGYAESYTYNNRGLLSTHERTVGGVTYAIDHAYDTLSRLEVMTYPGPNNRLQVKHVYNAYGYPTELRDNSSNALYRRIGELDQHGNVVSELYGNGLATIRYHNRRNGVLETIQTFDLLNTPSAQNLAFAFDALGNLTSRSDYLKGFHESFGYDARNRLTATSADWGNGEVQTTALAYDVLGNITSKTGVGNYQYGSQCAGTQGPHAVCRITPGSVGTKDTTYAYDANGNLESGDGRTLTWSRFDKPTSIVTAGASTTLGYGPARELLTRSDTSGGATTSTTYIGGLYERVVLPGGTVEERHYVAGSVLVTVTGRTGGAPGTWRTRYLHTDHLGSVSSITDETGAEVAAFSFDAWGKRRAPTLASLIAQIGSPWANMTAWQKGNLTLAASVLGSALTNRGFTAHEQLDAVGLVHMGGRVYDAQIGRFLSADPFVQDPTDLQGLNRYSYVQNNPLSYTDPSGYFLKKLFRKIGGAIENLAEQAWQNLKTAIKRQVRQFVAELRELGVNALASMCGAYYALCYVGIQTAINRANGGTWKDSLTDGAVAYVQRQSGASGSLPEGGNGGGSYGWMVMRYDQDSKSVGADDTAAAGNAQSWIGQWWRSQVEQWAHRHMNIEQYANTPQQFSDEQFVLLQFYGATLGGMFPVVYTAVPYAIRLPVAAGVRAVPSPTALVTRMDVVANGAMNADRAIDLLRPAGSLIGSAGSSSKIRILSGGTKEAEAMFAQLSKGGQVVRNSPSGTVVRLEGGGTVGYRPVSRSGPPTIDVNIKGLGIREIKFQ